MTRFYFTLFNLYVVAAVFSVVDWFATQAMKFAEYTDDLAEALFDKRDAMIDKADDALSDATADKKTWALTQEQEDIDRWEKSLRAFFRFLPKY